VDDFVTISEAARIAGVPRSTIYRRIAEGALRTYTSPLNRRVRLVKRTDLAALLTPQPVESEERGKAAA
jgi:excisionase family DNA binding protein